MIAYFGLKLYRTYFRVRVELGAFFRTIVINDCLLRIEVIQKLLMSSVVLEDFFVLILINDCILRIEVIQNLL